METVTSQLQELDLKLIIISKNNPRKTFDEKAMEELTESVKLHGILQPLLVRPKGKKYELVCGERRLRAAKAADLITIPVNIRELTDDQAFEMMIVENLERKDVHPLEEAEAFKKMLDSGRYQIEDIAGVVAKPERFVVQRLTFVNLIDEIKQEFIQGNFGVGHAVQLARLTPEHQKEIYDDRVGGSWNRGWGTVSNLVDSISRGLNQLDKAVFDAQDKKLLPEVGSCKDCPKQSGANKLLFSDIEEEDVCFDSACFRLKQQAHVVKMINKIISGDSKMLLGKDDYRDVPEFVVSLAKENGLTILSSGDHFSSWDNGGEKRKLLYVNGWEFGQCKFVYLKKKATAALVEDSPEAEIQKIETRAVRMLELDDEEVWNCVRTWGDGKLGITLEDGKKFLDNRDPLNISEKIALLAVMANIWQIRDSVKHLGEMNREIVEGKTVDEGLLNQALRHFINHELNSAYGSHISSDYNAAFYRVIKEYYPGEVDRIETHFQQKAEKRIERTKSRIEKLENQKVTIN